MNRKGTRIFSWFYSISRLPNLQDHCSRQTVCDMVIIIDTGDSVRGSFIESDQT